MDYEVKARKLLAQTYNEQFKILSRCDVNELQRLCDASPQLAKVCRGTLANQWRMLVVDQFDVPMRSGGLSAFNQHNNTRFHSWFDVYIDLGAEIESPNMNRAIDSGHFDKVDHLARRLKAQHGLEDTINYTIETNKWNAFNVVLRHANVDDLHAYQIIESIGRSHSVDFIDALCKRGVKPPNHLLRFAVTARDIPLVRYLVKRCRNTRQYLAAIKVIVSAMEVSVAFEDASSIHQDMKQMLDVVMSEWRHNVSKESKSLLSNMKS